MSESHQILKVKSVIKDSFARAESNRNALRSKRSRKEVEYELKRTEAIKNTDISGEELQKVIAKIKIDLQNRRKTKLLLLLFSVITLSAVLLFL